MRKLTALCLICITVLVPATVSAADDADEVKPAAFSIHTVDQDGDHFKLEMEPGEERELAVALRNGGDEYGFALTYKADMYSKVNGGFAAREYGDETSGETEWIDYQDERLDIGPEDEFIRTFTVRVPADAEPGKYVAALVVQNAEASTMGDDGPIDLKGFTRNIIGVIITVPGADQSSWEFREASYETRGANSIVELGLVNTGNMWLKGTGEFWLETEDGMEFGRREVEMKTVYPSRETGLRVALEGHLDPGGYYAFAHLTDEATGTKAVGERIHINVPEPDDSGNDSGIAGLIQPPRIPGDGGDGSWLTLLALIAGVSGLAALAGILIGRRRRAVQRSAFAAAPVADPAANSTYQTEPKPTRAPTSGARRIKPLKP